MMKGVVLSLSQSAQLSTAHPAKWFLHILLQFLYENRSEHRDGVLFSPFFIQKIVHVHSILHLAFFTPIILGELYLGP